MATISSVYNEEALWRNDFKAITSFSEANAKTAVVLTFKDLQLLRIKGLQQKLFDHHMRFRVGGIEPERFDDTLKILDEDLLAYANALRNYEYLSQNTRKTIPSGFSFFGAPMELQEVEPCYSMGGIAGGILPFLYSVGGLLPVVKRGEVEEIEFQVRDWVKYSRFPERAHGGNFHLRGLQFRDIHGYETEERKELMERAEKLGMAVFGGAALIVPTLIMTLSQGRTTSLVTVCLATFFFAVGLARFSKTTTGKDILAATAAYTAVLVVFLGTSLASSTSSSTSS